VTLVVLILPLVPAAIILFALLQPRPAGLAIPPRRLLAFFLLNHSVFDLTHEIAPFHTLLDAITAQRSQPGNTNAAYRAATGAEIKLSAVALKLCSCALLRSRRRIRPSPQAARRADPARSLRATADPALLPDWR